MPNEEFKVHILNVQGIEKAKKLAVAFDKLLDELIGADSPDGHTALASQFPCREMSLVRTHLEMASFFAKKAMARLPENQQ